MSFVELSCVCRQQPLHSEAQVRQWRLHDQMEMSVEQAVGEAKPSVPADRTLEALEERLAVVVVADDGLPTASDRHDVVDGIRPFLARSSRHRAQDASGTEARRGGLHGHLRLGHVRGQTRGLTPDMAL
jgi:hypothetical protein